MTLITNTNTPNSFICNKLLVLLDTYNQIHNEINKNSDIIKQPLKNNNDKNIIKQTAINNNTSNNNPEQQIELIEINIRNKDEHNLIIQDISDIVIGNYIYRGYHQFEKIKTRIVNYLIAEILDNSPIVDISQTTFSNIITKLYPYQINNLNWMLNIEKQIYNDEFNDIKQKIIFKGGGLFDEVGMGKTLQIITLINSSVSTHTSISKNNKIYCKATLIIVPNHLCGQWEREFSIHQIIPLNIIKLLTKRHYNKYTYLDFTKADVVIVSANFFSNCNINHHQENDPLFNIKNIFNTDVNIFNLFWHRVVIDEFHEIETSNLFLKLRYIESSFRWIISGTPFKEKVVQSYINFGNTSLATIIDFLTFDFNIATRFSIYDFVNYTYIKNHFSRNTHNKNVKILQLPELDEETIWLNMSETERMIYNAYLADPNNTPFDVFLRQMCCHPMINDKLRESMLNKVESLTDIRDHIKKMYFGEFDKADENYVTYFNRIERIKLEMQEMVKENKKHLIGYQTLKEDLENAQYRIVEIKKIRDGKEKTLLYYKTFLELISDINKVTQENCSICLDNIKENDLGITFCGHIFCYSCISMVVKEAKTSGVCNNCPSCSNKLQLNNIFLIDNKSNIKNKDVNEFGTKLGYMINYIRNTPDKYRIIFSQWDYLLKEVGKVLEKNNILSLYCQGNVYQKDKVLRLFNSKDPAENLYKIIMLSSESTVSGSNLNNAEEVIFLDPVYGDKQYRLNTENQAIGRVRRLGNKFKKIKILRLLIKDSIEEEIFKTNTIN